jgi:hypothetical protein
MIKEKRPNIYWFIIDSVRTFRTGVDDRDRLEIMDEFAEDSIEFTNCYTSAPSSLLAAGALFTGYPSAFIGRHFNDWRFSDSNISTIKTLVNEHGFSNVALLNAREEREKYQFMLPPFPAKLLPKGYKLSDYAWRNSDLTTIFKYLMVNNKIEEPFIFNFWYDCRKDPNTSFHVAEAIESIKKAGFYENSMIIMTSDHGYPDPTTKLDESFFKGLGHDMILTDDNIKTPLFIKYPNAPKNIKIPNVVGHIDLIPTIFDFLQIPMNKTNDKNIFRGESLLPIINGDEKDKRTRRSDTRLTMDVRRITSLRSKEYKYLFYHDEKQEALYNLKKDSKEMHNLAETHADSFKGVINDFRATMKSYDEKLFEFHRNTLNSMFDKVKKKFISKSSNKNILIVSPAPIELLKILLFFISQHVDSDKITIASIGDHNLDELNSKNVFNINSISDDSLKELQTKKFFLTLYLTHNSRRVFLKSDIVQSIKTIKSKKKYLMNYNFDMVKYFTSVSISSYLKLFFDWNVKGYFYKQEPLYFFRDLSFFIKHMMKKLVKRNKTSQDLMTAREIMDYRNFQLKEESNIATMKDEELKYEIGRIEDWGKE